MGLPGPSQAVQEKKDAGAVRGSLGSDLITACTWRLAGQLPAQACKCLQENRAGLSLNFTAHPPWKQHLTHIYHWDFRPHCFPPPTPPRTIALSPASARLAWAWRFIWRKTVERYRHFLKNCLQALAILFAWWVERKKYSHDLESLSNKSRLFSLTGAIPLGTPLEVTLQVMTSSPSANTSLHPL